MQYTIDREPMLAAMSKVMGAVGSKSALPVLSCVFISAENNMLILTATDLEIEVKTSVECKVEEQGKVVVNAKKLLDIVRALPNESHITILKLKEKLKIKSGKSKFTIDTLSPDDFPLRDDCNFTSIHVAAPQILGLLTSVSHAMATGDVRQYLNGVLLEAKDGKLAAVATNGHCLSWKEIEVTGNPTVNSIVPRKFVLEAIKALNKQEYCILNAHEEFVQLLVGPTVITSRLIEGMYPNYNRVIPNDNPYYFVANRANFLSAASRAAILSNIQYRGLSFELTENLLMISGSNTEGEKSDELLTVGYDSDTTGISSITDFKFQLNANYVLSVLCVIQSDDVVVQFVDDTRALVFLPNDASHEKHVVMPMRI